METSSSASSTAESASFDFGPLSPILLVFLSAGGGIFLVALRRVILLKRREKRFHLVNTNQAALAIYAYLTDLTAFGASINPRSEELALKAKFSPHILTQDEVEELRSDAHKMARALYPTLPVFRKLVFKYGKCLL